DTLEAMGRPGDAAGGRRRSAMVVEDDGTSAGLKCLGELLERQHRHAEAAIAYERAMALSPNAGKLFHTVLMMRLVPSTLNAGRPAETLRWAEALVGFFPDGPMAPLARRMAAVASSILGQPDDAELHARVAAELSQAPEQRAEALGLLAQYAMRRGELDEA